MTIDAVRAGLRSQEVELPLAHRRRAETSVASRTGAQLFDAALACGPLGVNHRGLRLPLVGWVLGSGGPGGRGRRGDRPRRRPLVRSGAGLPRHLRAGPDDGRPQARGHPARRPARDAQASPVRPPRRPRRQLPEPARHESRARAEGVPRRRLALGAPREPPSCYFHTIFAKAMLGDPGSNALGAPARLEFRESTHGKEPVAGDRGAGRAHPPRRTTLARRADRAHAGPRTLDRLGAAAVTPTKYVFVTGGVVSSLGKGITAASLGRLLKVARASVQVQKFDPYINVDPGTMSPFQHGEVFVTEDGAETDLDIGHYERFIDENLTRNANHTPGRSGTRCCARSGRASTSGRPSRSSRTSRTRSRSEFAAAPRRRHRRRDQRDRRHGRRHRVASVPRGDPPVPPEAGPRTCSTCTSPRPFIDAAGELKTKPTQHSVNELRRIGIHPDIVVCRSARPWR